MLPSAFSAFLVDALRKMTPSAPSRAPSMRHPAVPNARVLRAVVLHLAESRRYISANPADEGSRSRPWRDNVRGIYLHLLDEHPETFLPQQRHGPFTYVIGGKAIFTHHDVAWSRRAIAVHAQHVAATADITMPALRRARFDGKPRVDCGQ
jgi:hypothetical protein